MNNPADPHRQLIEFESEADKAIAGLPLLQLPARAVHAGLHYTLFTVLRARALGLPPPSGIGETIMARLSYTLPLLRGLQAEPYGESARDAIGAFLETDPGHVELGQLLTYSHFAELMPEVHRGYYRVGATASGFRLTHPSPEFAEAQARDILLSELAIPFDLQPQDARDPEVIQLARGAPVFDPALFQAILTRKANRYLAGVAEARLVTDDALKTVFGFDQATFFRIRAAVFGLATLADDIATVLAHDSARATDGAGVSDETLEWLSVNFDSSFVVQLVAEASGVPVTDVERFISFFSIDYRQSPAVDQAGDGFFPPFARFENALLFSPALVMTFTQIRNALYAFSKLRRREFDSRVSHDLEPVLLEQVQAILPRNTDWIVRQGVEFPGGEIDLVIGDPVDETILSVQAKAPLPPQGARLTERLAGRIREGLTQIERFRSLNPDMQRDVLSRALDRRLDRPKIVHGLLARSCFGGTEAWTGAPDLALITLATLSLGVKSMALTGRSERVTDLIAAVRDATEAYVADAAPRWEEGRIELIGREIFMPLLKFDQDKVDETRRRAWAQ